MTKKLRDFLKDQVVVFDIDGVLASYEFGENCHTADIWEEAFVSVDDNPYCTINPLPALQNYISEMPLECVFACSVADSYEAEAKKAFVLRNYPIPADQVYLVDSKDKKIEVMKKLAVQFPDKNVALVEDTVKTLDSIHSNSDFITVHITSFFD